MLILFIPLSFLISFDRSLVLGPTDEVDATITLSSLSRQAEANRFAERTLLDPLAKMNCSLNSPIFGIGIPSNLELGITNSLGESMERIVNGDTSVQMNYRQHHQHFCKQLFNEAGGEEKYVLMNGQSLNIACFCTSSLFHSLSYLDCLSNTSFILHILSISGLQIGEMKP